MSLHVHTHIYNHRRCLCFTVSVGTLSYPLTKFCIDPRYIVRRRDDHTRVRMKKFAPRCNRNFALCVQYTLSTKRDYILINSVHARAHNFLLKFQKRDKNAPNTSLSRVTKNVVCFCLPAETFPQTGTKVGA